VLWRALAQTDESALRISGMLLLFSLFSRRADSGAIQPPVIHSQRDPGLNRSRQIEGTSRLQYCRQKEIPEKWS
jgi:hypothetical protein